MQLLHNIKKANFYYFTLLLQHTHLTGSVRPPICWFLFRDVLCYELSSYFLVTELHKVMGPWIAFLKLDVLNAERFLPVRRDF